MPVVRMEVDVQNQGFAAGLAAGMTTNKNRTVRNVDIQELQRMLCSLGNLPESVLYEHDGYDPEQAVPEFAEFAEVYRNPDEELPKLRKKMLETNDPELAALLAFFKDASGRELLVKAVTDASWDQGWEFRGMGQFGPAASALDAKLIALANIADGSEKSAVLALLGSLTPDLAFSHFRAIASILRKSPCSEAVPLLENLLSTPELTDNVECSFAQIISKNSTNPCDNIQRTFQLKELYLLKALQSCDPENELALSRLKRYSESPQFLYASFAEA